jgi:DNA modification methylase
VNRLTQDGLKPKDMIGIPWMVAFALRSDGWYLRSDIIWAKPNPMPESVTDRPTKAHEYLFLLSKSQHYYYDAEAIKEQGAYDPGGVGFGHGTDAERRGRSRVRYSFARKVNESPVPGMHPQHRVGRENIAYCDTRNKRTVWTIATHPFLEAHFATFPPALVEPCILAGSSHMSCSACGAPWKRVVRRRSSKGTGMRYQETDTVGWMPTCSCPGNDGSGCCIVLDPFLGSGTTAMVATQNGRDYIGIELNPAYVRMAQKRLQGVVYQQRLFV